MSLLRSAVVAGLAVAAALRPDAATAHDGHAATPPRAVAAAALPPIPGFGGAFRLTDHTGRVRTDADFRGRLMLVTFGFADCPEVCPLELAAIAEAMDLLGPVAAEVVPLFVSVDPASDPPEKLAEFVGRFHPAIVGLTGTEAEVGRAVRAYRVHVQRGTPGGGTDHSAFMYLMDRSGGFLGLIRPGATAEEIALRIAKYAGPPQGSR